MKLTSIRRRLGRVAVLAIAGACALVAVFVAIRWIGPAAATSGGDPYTVPLVIDTNPDPNVVETTLVAEEATVNIGNGVVAHAQTFNGQVPGPQFNLKVGDTVIVHFYNQLPTPTGIHWHGIELNNASDGTPVTQNQVPPGGSFLYKFKIVRPGIFWYHPHHHSSTNQVFKGLYGPIIVTDPYEAALQANGTLPPASQTVTLALADVTVCKAPGSNDTATYSSTLPWVGGGTLPTQPAPTPATLCEAPTAMDEDGSLRSASFAAGDIPNIQQPDNRGRTNEGQTVLTNGKNVGGRGGNPSSPGALAAGASKLDVLAGQGLRLRIGNTAAIRFFRLRLTDGTGIQIPIVRIGGEGGLLDNAVTEGTLPSGACGCLVGGTPCSASAECCSGSCVGSICQSPASFDVKYLPGEILLDPGGRADVAVAIPSSVAVGSTLTLWTEDFCRTGMGFADIPTVPVMHLNVTGVAGSPYTISAGTALRSAFGSSALVEALGTASGVLLNPASFAPNKPGLASQQIQLTRNLSALGIDNVVGNHECPGDYTTCPHPNSTRYAKLGDTLELTVGNTTNAHHPFHLHGFSIQPLDLTRSGNPTYTWPYHEFRDNVDVPAGYTLRFRVRLDDRPLIDGTSAGGALGRWVFHCHILFHAVFGMISEFDVVDPNGNERPNVNADQAFVQVDHTGDTATMTGTYSDPDGDTVTLTGPALGTFTDNGDGTWSWSYTTTGAPQETEPLYVTATDAGGHKAQTAFVITTYCSNPPKPDGTTCNDGNQCTHDTCRSGVCVGAAVANGTLCSDTNTCTVNDTCTAGVCGGGTCYCTQAGGGAVGWWPGDGNANDISGNNQNGTLTNGATANATGKVQQAFSSPGYVALPPSPAFDFGTASVMAWIYPTGGTGEIFRSRNDWTGSPPFNLYLNGTGLRTMRHHTSACSSLVTTVMDTPQGLVPANTWSHVALTFGGGTYRIYVNGVLITSGAGGDALLFSPNCPVRSGRPAIGDGFSGLIDEVILHNGTLSAQQRIQQVYEAGSQGKCKHCTDADGDGYGLAGDTCRNGTQPDCNDADSTIHPGASDATCDGIDENCSAQTDEGFPGGCQCVEAGSGFVSWWPGEGNANDIRGGNNGTLVNGARFAAGEVGQAFALDGVNDYVNVVPATATALYPGAGSFSVGAWIKPNSSGQILAMYECGGSCPSGTANSDYELYVTSGVPGFFMRDSDTTGVGQSIAWTGHALNDGAWHHVVGSRDMSTNRMSLYVDGALQVSAALGPAADGSLTSTDGETDPLIIGATVVGGSSSRTSFFWGLIDEAFYANRALSPAEIQAMYDTGAAGLCRCIDADGDGYGAQGGVSCAGGTQQDCKDDDTTIHPGATDATCDGIDENCSGQADEGSSGGCQCSEVGSGLVSWWPGEDNASDIRGGNVGTPVGGATFAAGMVGQAFSLEGTDDYVSVPYTAALVPGSGSFSVAAWIRTTLTSRSQVVFAMYECGGFCSPGVSNSLYELALGSGNGIPSWALQDSTGATFQTVTAPSSAADGSWHLLAARRDMSTMKMDLYVDGALAASSTLTTDADGPIRDDDGEADPVTIGAEIDAGSSSARAFFLGSIDEVMYFNRALSPAEIQAIYNGGSTGMCRCIDADGDGRGLLGGESCPRGMQQDCNDESAGVLSSPLEAKNLRLVGKATTTLTWDDQVVIAGPDVAYDVVRGSLGSWPVGSGIEVCVGSSRWPSPTATDSAVPSAGTGYWYVVRGHDSCGAGTYGYQGNHGLPGPERLSAACP